MTIEEAQLVARAQKGDDQAFTSLVENYQNAVFHLCYRMLGDGPEAEDAAQESFLRAYRNMHRYDKSRPFATWLLSIASHYCIDQLRKRRMTLVSLDGLPGEFLPDPGQSPEGEVRTKEGQRMVRELLHTLNPTDRAAVTLYYWYDCSYEEIAAMLKLTESAVKSRLHRARQAMAEAWLQKHPAPATSAERRRYDESPAF